MVLVSRDAEPGVGDFDPRELTVPVQAQLDVSALRRVLDGVVDEVRDHLAKLARPPATAGTSSAARTELDAARQVKPRPSRRRPRQRDRVEPLVLRAAGAGV
jgi:hypothetical protein